MDILLMGANQEALEQSISRICEAANIDMSATEVRLRRLRIDDSGPVAGVLRSLACMFPGEIQYPVAGADASIFSPTASVSIETQAPDKTGVSIETPVKTDETAKDKRCVVCGTPLTARRKLLCENPECQREKWRRDAKAVAQRKRGGRQAAAQPVVEDRAESSSDANAETGDPAGGAQPGNFPFLPGDWPAGMVYWVALPGSERTGVYLSNMQMRMLLMGQGRAGASVQPGQFVRSKVNGRMRVIQSGEHWTLESAAEPATGAHLDTQDCQAGDPL